MRAVAVVGVGLIGGSFARALRAQGFEGEILGVSSAGTVEEAVRLGVISRGVSLEEAAATADLLYLAQPICTIITTIRRLGTLVRPGTLVTDAGSTKQDIVRCAAEHLPAGCFLGGHPMAGKEVRGVAAADANLFQKRTYFLVAPVPSVLEHPVAEEFVESVERMGARPVLLTAEEHDNLVAFTSHMPQMASTALASALEKLLDLGMARKGAGPGLLDMTRLAQSSHDLWADILNTNSRAIDRALSLYIKELQEVRSSLQKRDLSYTFERAGRFASFLRSPAAGPSED